MFDILLYLVIETVCFIVCFAASATQEAFEISKTGSEFVEIGYIYNVHGLQGEIRVKPSTDFPELRFSKVKQTIFFRRLLRYGCLFLSILHYVMNNHYFNLSLGEDG
jgi:hypothetical protein